MLSQVSRKVVRLCPLGFYPSGNFDVLMTAKAFVLINTELGSEGDLVEKIKSIPNVTEAYLVYGTYDIIVKVESDSLDKVKETITHNLRTLSNVRSTLSMVVVEG